MYYLSKYQTDIPVMLGVVEVLTKLVVDFPIVDSENMFTQHENLKNMDSTILIKTCCPYI